MKKTNTQKSLDTVPLSKVFGKKVEKVSEVSKIDGTSFA